MQSHLKNRLRDSSNAIVEHDLESKLDRELEYYCLLELKKDLIHYRETFFG